MYEDLKRDMEQLRSALDTAESLLGKFVATYSRHQLTLLTTSGLNADVGLKLVDAPSVVRGEFIAAKTKVDMLLGVLETIVDRASAGAGPAP